MEIKSVNAPAIGQAGVDRLWAFARASKMTRDSTLFEAGYEQAKADLRDRLAREIAVPAERPVRTAEAVQDHAEAIADAEKRAWWKQWLR